VIILIFDNFLICLPGKRGGGNNKVITVCSIPTPPVKWLRYTLTEATLDTTVDLSPIILLHYILRKAPLSIYRTRAFCIVTTAATTATPATTATTATTAFIMSGKRKRSTINYNEQKLANEFDIKGETMKSVKTSKNKMTTAQRERIKEGKKPYRGNEGNKTAPTATELSERMPLPTRNKHNELVFTDYPEFRPNLTPAEVLERGSFGGTYFRPITSAVTGLSYKSKDVLKEFPREWIKNLPKNMVISRTYDKSINMYNVKCGGSLDMWEGSGWISNIDPYGWFQWYCRFYLGRRSTDDLRQIKRANGVCGIKGRFRNQLIGKCARSGTTYDDVKISPVIRQALQHWGYVLTERDANKYVKLKGLPKLKKSK
jgi:hypothetical protein